MINFQNFKIKVCDFYNRIKNWVIYKIYPRSDVYENLIDQPEVRRSKYSTII